MVVALCAVIVGLVASQTIANTHVRTRAIGGVGVGARIAAQPPGAGRDPRAGRRPNIVFVLTDDLSMDLLQYMPQVQLLAQRGMSLHDYFVSDSLCCPSRASIFTGNFPHDTHVFSNTGTRGGFNVFHRRGEERHTFATALQAAGYRTALMGKYLNGYLQTPAKGGDPNVPDSYVPPGWNEWDVAGWGYPEFNYALNEDGILQSHGNSPPDYLTDVLADRGVSFINTEAAAGRPFFLEIATFAPHSPYTPAPRDASLFPGLTAPEPPNFDRLPANAPRWLRQRPPLTADQIDQINNAFRLRAQAVQGVSEMLGRLEQALTEDGIANNTYVVFSSDNGLHTGEYRLMPGKMTAFDTDIHVPLIVAGPGVPAGSSTDAMAENIDLAKTFTSIAGTSIAGDGHSLLPVLHGIEGPDWRNAILVEHAGRKLNPNDPDFQQPPSGDPNSYEAIRTHRYLYVEYKRGGGREFYDLLNDPYELDNIYAQLTPLAKSLLHAQLLNLEQCHTGPACWAGMHVSPTVPSPSAGRSGAP
jgi:N-acetylglucosamine-6-sulfatase